MEVEGSKESSEEEKEDESRKEERRERENRLLELHAYRIFGVK